jgi:hypothetical protein
LERFVGARGSDHSPIEDFSRSRRSWRRLSESFSVTGFLAHMDRIIEGLSSR